MNSLLANNKTRKAHGKCEKKLSIGYRKEISITAIYVNLKKTIIYLRQTENRLADKRTERQKKRRQQSEQMCPKRITRTLAVLKGE